MAGSENFQKYMKGKAKPPKQLVEAMTMESANRAYLQQTLDRLRTIATGQAPDLKDETAQKDSKSLKPKPVKKKTSVNKSTAEGKTGSTVIKKEVSRSRKKAPAKTSSNGPE
jgi:hypothetical protein